MICYICNKQEVSLQCPLCKRYVCSKHTTENPFYGKHYRIIRFTPEGGNLKDCSCLCCNCAKEVIQCDFCDDVINEESGYCEECGKKFCKKHGATWIEDEVFRARCNQHKGWCFIATACMAAKGLPDDCFELNTLRSFRDMYIKPLPEGEKLISEYYEIAPRILERISQTKHAKDTYLGIYERLVLKSLKLIQEGEKDKAFKNIVSIVNDLKQKYL